MDVHFLPQPASHLDGLKGSKSGRKGQLNLLIGGYSWVSFDHRWAGGVVDMRSLEYSVGLSSAAPPLPRSLGLSRLDGHLLGFLLRSYLGVLGRKPTTPAHLGGGVVVYTHRQTYMWSS